MSTPRKRRYKSDQRDHAAEATKSRILDASKSLFARHGIDRVTIAQIGRSAKVAESTVYALFKSKGGILRALMTASLFGPRFQEAQSLLAGTSDSERLIALSAHVARVIYESESSELGLLRGASSFSPELRRLEQEFENLRLQMQEARIRLLFAQSKAKKGLDFETARRILWMYTSREIYRMLVQEGGWTPDRYQDWLSDTLVKSLVETTIPRSKR
jgi:AcrR family transcriptional regulator